MTKRVHHLVRWVNKPFSGRLVYKTPYGWFWQCDLHVISASSLIDFPTHAQALENALLHAKNCPERNH